MPFSVIRLFPTGIIKTNIDRAITDEEMDVVNYHRNLTNHNVGNVFSKNTYILDNELQNIRKFIEYGIEAYVKTIIDPYSDNLQFYITQSWLNYSDPEEFHHRHPHPNSIISGSFYINADPEYDNIVFHKELYQQISFDSKNTNMFNCRSHQVDVKTGDLVLFPSYLEHSVPNTRSKNTRISLAFNVFAKGNFCKDDLSLSQLKI